MQYTVHLAATDHGELMTLVAGKRRSLLMAEDDDEVYNKKPQRYAEDKVTIIKDSARGIILLRRTTHGHKASRGLSATPELLGS